MGGVYMPKDKSKNKSEVVGVDYSDEMKRLNRVAGQLEGVRKMLDERRSLGEILAQCKAVHSALRSIENRILKSHLENVLDEVAKLEKKKSREQKVAEIEELFKQAS
ncbi:MAG: transcriptional regulator [Alphaproteobacteria bacterium]|nr:transcriptional regulator [Alphaproteobacteria bacterium]